MFSRHVCSQTYHITDDVSFYDCQLRFMSQLTKTTKITYSIQNMLIKEKFKAKNFYSNNFYIFSFFKLQEGFENQ